jgi:hypothetical protein
MVIINLKIRRSSVEVDILENRLLLCKYQYRVVFDMVFSSVLTMRIGWHLYM